MNFCGIICEFNPFHNGHEYLIKVAKQKLDANIVCLMSGDFVQRGDMAIASKYERAKCAVFSGADMVAELPTIYACSNAENFAFGAIKTLKSLGVTHLAFGIENASLNLLEQIATLKFENKQKFHDIFKNEIENEISFNIALKRAIVKAFDGSSEIEEVLQKPNNILAIEYLVAIKKLDAKIIPFAIKRCDNGYYSTDSKNQFASASLIRQKIEANEKIENFVPSYAICNWQTGKEKTNLLDALKLAKIRELPVSKLSKIYDYSEGIEYLIKKTAENETNYDEMIKQIISPRYREARVKKLLLYPLFGITKQVSAKAKTSKSVAKLLAIKKEKKELLSKFSKSKISLIVTSKDYERLTKIQKQIIEIDLKSSNISSLINNEKFNKDKKIGTLFL